jgi:ketosteroid isomerase-like protein
MKKPIQLTVLFCALLAAGGAEALEPPSADAGFRTFLATWETAQSQFINGDPALWKQHCSRRDDVTILGGFGGFGEKGWDAVGRRYEWASSQYKPGGATMKPEYISVVVTSELAYTVAIERQQDARVGTHGPSARALRVTQVFRKEDGAWKLIHRHADPLVEKQAPPPAKP